MPTPEGWSPTATTPIWSGDLSNTLPSGVQWASGTLSFSFPAVDAAWSEDKRTGYGLRRGDGEPWSDSYAPLTAGQQTAVRLALDAWAAVADLRFDEVAETDTAVGDLRFAFVDMPDGFQAYAYLPDETAFAGDVWFGIDSRSVPDWQPGSYEFLVAMHEIGHALGLKHPFETESGNARLLPPGSDTRFYTVMSYSAAPGDQGSWLSLEPTTPMLLDVAAMQKLYGASASHNAGDTVYTFRGDTTYLETIWDSGGNDTISYRGGNDASIRLTGGYVASTLGQPVWVNPSFGPRYAVADTVFIAFDTVIENATGGKGDDHMFGNVVANRLLGGAGTDELRGDGGDDTLKGGGGQDSLYGDQAADRLLGGAGSDTLDGGRGDPPDTLEGGKGDDTYYTTSNDVVVETRDGGIDEVVVEGRLTLPKHVENARLWDLTSYELVGNESANRLEGNLNGDTLRGMDGDDTLLGGNGRDLLDGGAGADLLDGGPDQDLYVVGKGDTIAATDGWTDYDEVRADTHWTLGAAHGTLVLLGTGNWHGAGNALANRMEGNGGDNLLAGAGGDDLLDGREGDDTLRGDAGDDTLQGGLGTNRLSGGPGSDHYLVSGLGDVIVELPDEGYDEAQSSVSFALDPGVEVLQLTGTEPLLGFGNDLDNLITGNNGANRLRGNDGADTLRGGKGADSLYGGAGSDRYEVDGAHDLVVELSGEGDDDVVVASVDYTLTDGVETLMLVGDAHAGGGNALANRVVGSALADTLAGGGGNDTLEGGSGFDLAVAGGAGSAYRLGLDADGSFRLSEVATPGAGDGVDTLRSVEGLRFADGDVTLSGPQAVRVMGDPWLSDAAFDAVALAGGGQAVLWSTGDGQWGIQADTPVLQVLDSAGAPVSAPIVLEDMHLWRGAGLGLSMDALADGGFVVMVANEGIRRFDGAGTPVGEDLVLGLSPDLLERAPAVTGLADGSFVAACWALDIQTDQSTLYLRHFAADGSPMGAARALDTGADAAYPNLTLTALAGGGVLAAWTTAAAGARMRAFDADGAVASELLVVRGDGSGVSSPIHAAALADGGWVIGYSAPGADGSADVYMRRYAADGTPAGGAVVASNSTTGEQIATGIATLPDGGWALAWLHEGTRDTDVLLRFFDASGAPVRSMGVLEQGMTLPGPALPVVTGDGALTLAWRTIQDGETAVFARRIEAPGVDAGVRGDDSGNTVTWSGSRGVALSGNGGDDSLTGAGGSDVLRGGAGDDTLSGGAGADRFVLDQAPDVTGDVDHVLDFASGTDRLVLDDDAFDAFDAGTRVTPLSTEWRSGPGVTSAKTAAQRLLYDESTGALYYDPDGTGEAPALLFAVLGTETHPALLRTDVSIGG
jgi:serralysin